MMFTSRPRICTAVIVPCPMDWGSSDDWSIGPLVHVLEKTWFEHKKKHVFFYDVSFWKSVGTWLWLNPWIYHDRYNGF